MEWYWNLACFIQPLDAHKSVPATGAAVSNHLRSEMQTGFPDIETAAAELSCVADKLRSIWEAENVEAVIKADHEDIFIVSHDVLSIVRREIALHRT